MSVRCSGVVQSFIVRQDKCYWWNGIVVVGVMW